ncbi:MAG: hypothetical protein RLZ12_638 [Bacillota bacterium]
MLSTLLRPDGGKAEIFGYDVVKKPQIVRQLIRVTGQYAALDEKLSALENLLIFARLQGLRKSAAKKRAGKLLEQFGLMEAAERTLSKFSGGMRRRLDLAVSLIIKPPLIFLDEPTTGLDPHNRAQMWDIIRKLVKTGSTVLLTTQYLDEADQLADWIAVIDKGKVVAEGTPNNLKERVGTASLQLSITKKEQVLEAQKIITSYLGCSAVRLPEGRAVSVPMPSIDQAIDLLATLRAAGIGLEELSVQKPSLDEVFLAVTGEKGEL